MDFTIKIRYGFALITDEDTEQTLLTVSHFDVDPDEGRGTMRFEVLDTFDNYRDAYIAATALDAAGESPERQAEDATKTEITATAEAAAATGE